MEKILKKSYSAHELSTLGKEGELVVSFASDGLRAVVKFRYDDMNEVYVYERATRKEDFHQGQQLVFVNDEGVSGYGDALACSASGDKIVVGAFGAAYIFIRTKEGWKNVDIIQPTQRADGFGSSLGISSDGNWIIAGYRYGTLSGTRVVADIFKKDGSYWVRHSVLEPQGNTVHEGFGVSVGISNDGRYAIVGACGTWATKCTKGAAYMFNRHELNWEQMGILVAPSSSENCFFGLSVALVDSAGATTAKVGHIHGTFCFSPRFIPPGLLPGETIEAELDDRAEIVSAPQVSEHIIAAKKRISESAIARFHGKISNSELLAFLDDVADQLNSINV